MNATTGEITVYLRDENEELDFDSEQKVYFFTVIARDNPGFSPSSMIFFYSIQIYICRNYIHIIILFEIT